MPKGCTFIKCQACGRLASGNVRSLTCYSCLDAGIKVCTKCHRILPIEEFHSSGQYNTTGKCRECYNALKAQSQKERYHTDSAYRHKLNEANNRCAKKQKATEEGRLRYIEYSHRYRAQLYGSYSPEQYMHCLDYFGHECAYCGKTGELTVEHIIPVSRFGANKIYNVIPACRACNSSKCDHDILEWYPKQPFYTEARLLKIHSWFKDMQKEVM